jgi:hypothetical protein
MSPLMMMMRMPLRLSMSMCRPLRPLAPQQPRVHWGCLGHMHTVGHVNQVPTPPPNPGPDPGMRNKAKYAGLAVAMAVGGSIAYKAYWMLREKRVAVLAIAEQREAW